MRDPRYVHSFTTSKKLSAEKSIMSSTILSHEPIVFELFKPASSPYIYTSESLSGIFHTGWWRQCCHCRRLKRMVPAKDVHFSTRARIIWYHKTAQKYSCPILIFQKSNIPVHNLLVELCTGLLFIYLLSISIDGVQPKMSPTISFYGMYQKPFIYRRNRTNSQ